MTGERRSMRTFGSYELIATLASGGMSTLWLARSPGADGIVVLKRLLREHLGEPDVVAMFEDEALLGDLLRHPNLIRQYEYGIAEGEPYIVLERLEGEDLRSIRRAIKKKGEVVPLDVALEIVIRAGEGLHAAHELRAADGTSLGVVHRDVSPHNLIVTFDGHVKVLDFGIAKSGLRRIETRTGVLKGKIPYMAPEQIRAEHVDRRADVYALGVMLYELTVGERPYFMASPSEFALMMAIVRGDIRWPTAAKKDYPSALEAIVMRALSGTPQQRPATAADLAAQLAAFRDKEGLRSGRELLAEWMTRHFTDRIDALRRAASPEELAARIADAEKRRRSSADDDDVETAAKGLGASLEPAAGAQYTLSRRPLGAAVLATIAGRINESFDGGLAGRALAEAKLVVLDLSGVERITSYGVREWLAMLSVCKDAELWLARCSEPIVTQLSTIKGFSGHGRVASVLLSFRCDACGTATTVPFDLELDGAELASGSLAPRPCAQCGAEASPDDDPAALLFAKRWLGKPVPAPVRGALAVLDREGEGAPPPFEKIVLGTETHVRIRRAADRRLRFRRLLDGIEGHLRVDVRDPGALDEKAAADLARSLLDLGPEVTSIAVHGATRALADGLAGSPRVTIASRFAAARCPGCDAPRTALVAEGGSASAPACGRCGSELEILGYDDVAPASTARPPTRTSDPGARARDSSSDSGPRSQIRAKGTGSHAEGGAPSAEDAAQPPSSAARPSERATHSPVVTSDAHSSHSRRFPAGRVVAVIAVAAALAAAGAWLRWGRTGAAPDAASSAPALSTSTSITTIAPAPSAAPAPPEDRIEKRDGAREITATGRGATDDDALNAARERAIVLLVDAVRAALPADVREATDRAGKAAPPGEVARRFLLHLGAGATPERIDTRPVASPGERALAVRFRVSDATFDRAVAHFGATSTFRGARVAQAFPAIAEAGWLVVTAPRNAALHPGDRIVSVGDVAIAPADRPSALTGSAPELRIVRGDSTMQLRWPPQGTTEIPH